jgi:ferredoxin-NADP reductase
LNALLFFENIIEHIADEFKVLSETHEHFAFVPEAASIRDLPPFEEYYICGNPNFVVHTEHLLLQQGISKKSIHYEKY